METGEKVKLNVMKLDPRTKLIIVLSISSNAVFIRNIYLLLSILLISVIISWIMKSNLLSVIKRIKSLIVILLLMVIIQSIFSPSGKNLISIGGFSILSTGGIEKGIEIFLRISIIIVSATIITTSSFREIVQGLVQWKIPYEIAFMVLVGIRFLPLLTEEIKDVMISIQLRGIEVKKIPFKKKIKLFSYVFTPIVANTIIKAQKLSTAMETRAFRAYPNRTSYMTIKMCFWDYIIIAVSLVLGIGAAALYCRIGG